VNPKRLKDSQSRTVVREMLNTFYSNKPPEYDLLNRGQAEYDAYARVVAKYAKPQGRVLDFGAGTWRSPATIAQHKNSTVAACDFFSEDELTAYRTKTTELPVSFFSYDGNTLPFDDRSFDVVSSLCVLEHVLDVDRTMSELDRVLKPGGVFVIMGPNWSGLNNPVRGLFTTLLKRQRYWHFENSLDSIIGIPRVFLWTLEVLSAREPCFLLIQPRTKNGAIHFETGDDDCVHLCHPVSFKRWFKSKSYDILQYNRGEGRTLIARLFNEIVPSLATTNVIVATKNG